MADDQSIWKKEISFGRKRKEPAPEPEATDAAEATTDEPTSIWKKELSFGKKKAAPEPVVDDVLPRSSSSPRSRSPKRSSPLPTSRSGRGRCRSVLRRRAGAAEEPVAKSLSQCVGAGP